MAKRMHSAVSVPEQGKPLLLGIVLVCCAIEALLTLADWGVVNWPGLRAQAYELGAFWPGLLRDWQSNYPGQTWVMFVSYGFLHGGLLHLSFNMITLWSLGAIVVDRAGVAGFLWIYGASMVIGAGVFGMMSASGQPMVGASGALFGLAGAICCWIWVSRPTTAKSFRATRRLLGTLIAINVVMYIVFSGQLAWETHLGGFLAGWGVALGLRRWEER